VHDRGRAWRNLRIFWLVLIGTPILTYVFVIWVLSRMTPGY
jgi:hypothetical protein